MPRKPDMSEEFVQRNMLGTAAILIHKLANLIDCRFQIAKPLEPGIYQVEITEVLDLSDELHPKVLVTLQVGGRVDGNPTGSEDQAGKAEHGEGAVSD